MTTPTTGWRIERDADPDDDEFPHALRIDGSRVRWLTDAQADSFPAPGPQRFTASQGSELNFVRIHDHGEPCDAFFCGPPEQAAAFRQQVNNGTIPEPLPEGVTLRPVLDAQAALPDGWRWVEGHSPAPCASSRFPRPVERIPQPATVKVPWQQCIGRTLPGGDVFDEYGEDRHGRWLFTKGWGTRLRSLIDANGEVEVLAVETDV